MEYHFELYTLNLADSTERMRKIEHDLRDSPRLRMTRIEAVKGSDLKNVPDAPFLDNYTHLVGSSMHSHEFKQTWVYDGTLDTAFSGLNLHGHDGYKGLTLSNLRAMEAAIASKNPEPWLCIAEDDARLPKEVIQEIEDTITTTTDHDIVWFDSRGLGGTSLVCYHKSVLPQVVKHMHPLSDFSRTYEERFQRANLWDWQLGSYTTHNHRLKVHPLVKSGDFISLISPPT